MCGGCGASLLRSVKGCNRGTEGWLAHPQTCRRIPSPQSSACTPCDTSLPLSFSLSPSCSHPPPPSFFLSSLLSRSVSPSLSSSGSVVCFQEIRPLLISHMSRVELGKTLCVCVCMCSFCVCVPVFVSMWLCGWAYEFAHLYMRWRLEKKRASTDSKFSSLAASSLQVSSRLQSCVMEAKSNIVNFTFKLTIFTPVSLQLWTNSQANSSSTDACKHKWSNMLFL